MCRHFIPEKAVESIEADLLRARRLKGEGEGGQGQTEVPSGEVEGDCRLYGSRFGNG